MTEMITIDGSFGEGRGQLLRSYVEGAELGSTELDFEPGAVCPGKYEFAVGTAGSPALTGRAERGHRQRRHTQHERAGLRVSRSVVRAACLSASSSTGSTPPAAGAFAPLSRRDVIRRRASNSSNVARSNQCKRPCSWRTEQRCRSTVEILGALRLAFCEHHRVAMLTRRDAKTLKKNVLSASVLPRISRTNPVMLLSSK